MKNIWVIQWIVFVITALWLTTAIYATMNDKHDILLLCVVIFHLGLFTQLIIECIKSKL